jgi:hypothetical protein
MIKKVADVLVDVLAEAGVQRICGAPRNDHRIWRSRLSEYQQPRHPAGHLRLAANFLSERCLIFAKSYRAKRHRHVVHGTGKGFCIANMIVRAHGGSLRVASQRGRGCIFSFTLPADFPLADVRPRTSQSHNITGGHL